MKNARKMAYLLAAGLCLGGAALAEDRALIIGVGQYSNPRDNLPGIDLDVNMAREMSQKLGFKPSQIQTLLNEQATHQNIMAALSQMARDTRAQDRVLIYFSGHGQQVKDLNDEEDDGCDEALVPYDQDNPIIDDDLDKALNALSAKQVLLLIDSCFSATVTKSVLPQTAKYIKTKTECNVARNKGSRSIGVGDVGTRLAITTTPNANTPNSSTSPASTKVIEFTAAADNEYAQASQEGSLFTLGLYQQVMTGQATSFERLRQSAAQYIAQNSNKPSVPSLLGPPEWLTRNIFNFGRLETAPRLDDTSGVVGSGDVTQAFSTIVQGKTSALDLTSNQRLYRLNDEISFTVNSPIPGYLNVLEYNPDGSVTVLFPNKFQRDNRVVALQPVYLPGGAFEFFATEPRGKSQVLALVTTKPLNLFNERLAGQLDSSGFRTLVDSDAFSAFGGLLASKAVGTRQSSQNQQYAAGLLNLEVR